MQKILIKPINQKLTYKESLELFTSNIKKELNNIPKSEKCIGRNDNTVAFGIIKEVNHIHFLIEFDRENEQFYAITLDFLTFTRQSTYINIVEAYSRKKMGSEFFKCKITIGEYLKSLKISIDS